MNVPENINERLIQKLGIHAGEYLILCRKGRTGEKIPFLCLPRKNVPLFVETLSLYNPQRFLIRSIVHTVRVCLLPLARISRLFAERKEGYGFLLGNPSRGIPRAIAIHATGTDETREVVKFCEAEYAAALRNEYARLQTLKEICPDCAPTPLYEVEKPEIYGFAMERVCGQGINTLTHPGVFTLLEKLLRPGSVPPDHPLLVGLTEKAGLTTEEKATLSTLNLRSAVLHGDFAPWNLIDAARQGVKAIDWEWMETDGIAGIDLAYGFIRCAVLLDGLSGKQLCETVVSRLQRTEAQHYLALSGWSGHEQLLFELAQAYLELTSEKEQFSHG